MLVEQEADAVARDEGPGAGQNQRNAGGPARRTQRLYLARQVRRRAGQGAVFLVAYMPLEFGAETKAEQQKIAKDILEKYGDKPRSFRNGLGLAVPTADQIEILRRAVRYLLAIERVKTKSKQHNLTDEQKGQLRERESTEKAAAESAFLETLHRSLAAEAGNGSAIGIETVAVGGRPLQTTLNEKKEARIHERVMELLTQVQKRVFDTVTPGKIVGVFQTRRRHPAQTRHRAPAKSSPASIRSSASPA